MPKDDREHNLLEKLKSHYFWDVEVSDLDLYNNRKLIVGRVFALGTLEEIQWVIAYYGRLETITILQQTNHLDAKTLNLVSKLFRIPKKSFKCFKRNLSITPHWNS